MRATDANSSCNCNGMLRSAPCIFTDSPAFAFWLYRRKVALGMPYWAAATFTLIQFVSICCKHSSIIFLSTGSVLRYLCLGMVFLNSHTKNKRVQFYTFQHRLRQKHYKKVICASIYLYMNQ
jgi:hypothetical protein